MKRHRIAESKEPRVAIPGMITSLLALLILIPGCIDAKAVTQKAEIQFQREFPSQIEQLSPVKLQFDLLGFKPKNPYDRNEISVNLKLTCPDGTELIHPGFYTVDHKVVLDHGKEVVRDQGRGHWEIRWTPLQSGEYQWSIVATSNEKNVHVEGKSNCNSSNKPGFARISKSDPQYFEFSNQSFFYPIGHVTRSPSDTRWLGEEAAKLPKHQALMVERTFAYERWFKEMEANHENFCAIWMAPWWLGIEWTPGYPGYEGLGRYNQIHAAQLDRILELAEKHGIYVLLFVMNHGQLSSVTDAEWEANPYRQANGGPATTASDVFRSEECDKLYQQRLNYILARWGYSPALFGFSLSTETDWVELFYGHRCDHATEVEDGISKPYHEIPMDRKKVVEWLQRLSNYIREHDVHHHLVTTQFSMIDSGHDVWPLPEFDVSLNNCYENCYKHLRLLLSRLSELDDPPGGVADLLWMWGQLHNVKTKPKLLAEWGGSHMHNSPSRLANELHTGLWSLLMTECGGATGFWWWNEIDASNLYPTFQAVHNFSSGYDRRGKHLKSDQGIVTTKINSPGAIETAAPQFMPHPLRAALTLSNETELFAYVYHRLVSAGFVTATSTDDIRLERAVETYLDVPNDLQPGKYLVEFWDTYKGVVIETREIQLEEPGTVSRHVPVLPVRSDVAIKMKQIADK